MTPVDGRRYPKPPDPNEYIAVALCVWNESRVNLASVEIVLELCQAKLTKTPKFRGRQLGDGMGGGLPRKLPKSSKRGSRGLSAPGSKKPKRNRKKVEKGPKTRKKLEK